MSKLLRSIQTAMKLTSSGSFLKNATFCGGVLSLSITAFTSPSFAQPNCGLEVPLVNVPFEKGAIEQFAQNNNYSLNQKTLGTLFENAALTSEGSNGIPFPANNRVIRVRGVGNAVPDIYLATVVVITDFFGNILYQSAPYADSFIGDVKAINPNGSVTDDDGQIEVYTAALAQSPAGVAPPQFFTTPYGNTVSVRPTPILFFPTTAFVRVHPTIVDNATGARVAVLQSISCQSLLTGGPNSLYISESDTLNPEVFEPPLSGSNLSNPNLRIPAGTSVPININAVDITNITPTSGSRRTEITIDGVNFEGNPASGQTITVEVNGVEARQLRRLSNTQVIFRVPARVPLGTGSVEVTVGGVTKIWRNFTVTP